MRVHQAVMSAPEQPILIVIVLLEEDATLDKDPSEEKLYASS